MKKINISNTFFHWVLSYIIITIICVLMSSFVYICCLNILKQQINKAHHASVAQLKNTIDSKLSEINRMSIELVFDNEVEKISNLSNDLKGQNIIDIKRLINNLKTYVVANDFIDSLYIYFDSFDSVVSSKAMYTPYLYYQLYYKEQAIKYNDWGKILHSKNNKTVHKTKNKLQFIRSIPVGNSEQIKATLVFEVDINRLKECVEGLQWIKDGNIIIANNNNILYQSNLNKQFKYSLNDWDKNNFDIQDTYTYSTNEDVLTYVKSDIYDWVYISIISKNEFFSRTKIIRILILLVVILSLIIGGLLSGYFSKKNYYPLRNIKKILESKDNKENIENSNDYQYIQSSVENLIQEKKRIYKKIECQNKILINNLFVKLLKGYKDDNIYLEDAFEVYNIKFDNSSFKMMLFYVEDDLNLFESTNLTELNQSSSITSHIKLVTKQVLNKDIIKHFIEIDNMLVCLLNYDDESINNNRYFNSFAEDIVNTLQQKCQLAVFIGIGKTFKEIKYLSVAYKELLEILENKLYLGGNNQVLDSEGIKKSVNNSCLDFSPEEEYKFINMIKSEEFNKATELFNQLIEKSKVYKKYNIQFVKLKMFNLINLMLKAVQEISYTYGQEFIKEYSPVDSIINCSSYEQLEICVNSIIENLRKYINEKNVNSSKELIYQVNKIVDERYDDKNMSVRFIADKVNLNPNYLSKLYKKSCSIGLLDYIHSVRISKAKKLLKDKKMNINKIADKLGYSTSITFIRAFKRQEGMTPGKYREISIKQG